MTVLKISPRGTMLTLVNPKGWTVNSYIIECQNKVYLIDTGNGTDDGILLKNYIDAHFAGKQTVVINTHNHFDHVWGNSIFADKPIIAQKLCYDSCVADIDKASGELKDYVAGQAVLCPPNVLFDKELYLPEDKLRLFRSVGHTSDGICVLDEVDKVLYAGDNIGDTVDQPVPWLNCPKQQYVRALQYMQTLDFEILASGHNEILTKDFIDVILEALKTYRRPKF